MFMSDITAEYLCGNRSDTSWSVRLNSTVDYITPGGIGSLRKRDNGGQSRRRGLREGRR